MDNFDLEKLLSENYCDTLNSLEPVNKERLYKLYKKPKASKIGRRAVFYKIAIAVLLLSLLAVGTVTATAQTLRSGISSPSVRKKTTSILPTVSLMRLQAV